MPYEVRFTKNIVVTAPDTYINDCCWGGDILRDELLPLVLNQYQDVHTAQEDWGWFIWFRKGDTRLAIDIFCDEPQNGSFRVRLTSSRRRLLFGQVVTDSPELEDLKTRVVAHFEASASEVTVDHVQ